MSEHIISAIIGAIAGAVVASSGWFINYYLSFRSQKYQNAIKHLELQICEFYAPLLALLQRSRFAYELASKKLPYENGRINNSKFTRDGEHYKIWRFFVEEYLLPTTSAISDLVRSKFHLVENNQQFKYFEKLFRHEIQFKCLDELWKSTGISSENIDEYRFPRELEGEISETLECLRAKYAYFRQRINPKKTKGRKKL
jgi:hypothetical protein